MDGVGMAFGYFLVFFYLTILPFGTIGALAIAGSLRRKSGTWKGWPRAILIGWGLVVFDAPLKFVLLGMACSTATGIWVADDFDRTNGVEGWRLSSGCDQECVRRFHEAPQIYQAFYVNAPNAAHYAGEKGYFEYWRAPSGVSHCVEEWSRVKATARLGPASDYPNGECLARAPVEGAPVGRPIYYAERERPSPLGVMLGWTYQHDMVIDAVTDDIKASIRNVHARVIWWLPWDGLAMSCPHIPSNVTITNVHRGDG